MSKWERRDSKKDSKKRTSLDNRKSVRLLQELSLRPGKLKRIKKKKF